MEKQHFYLQQIDKAAKILDLLGDFPHALQVLESIVDDPEIHHYKPILLETLVFLADISSHIGKFDDARRYIVQAEAVNLIKVDPAQVQASLAKLRRIKNDVSRAG